MNMNKKELSPVKGTAQQKNMNTKRYKGENYIYKNKFNMKKFSTLKTCSSNQTSH